MKYTVLSLVMTFFSLLSHAQNIHQDIEQINTTYANISHLEMTSNFQWYDTEDATKPSYTLKGLLQQSPKGNYAKLGPSETLINAKYAISVNHDEEIIMIQKAPDAISLSPGNVPLDSILVMCETYAYEIFEGQVSYLIRIKAHYAQSFDKMRIVFDKESYLISKMILFPIEDPTYEGAKPRVEIDFRHVHVDDGTKMEVSEAMFVRPQGNALLPHPQYQSYRLINLLTESN